MSSNYYVLCLSHDPAITAREYRTPEEAAEAIKRGTAEHPGCDLVIERVSGAPVEIGCSPSKTRSAGPRCYHRDVEWVDVKWLRLLALAYISTDPDVLDAAQKGLFYCWPRERLYRLRHSLGIAAEETA
ncbi:MAG TPA: hypothetical protein VFY14_04030 [Streptomyces sp.]|nr:hypothetical protein [Streptomyces sp.]